MRLLLLALALAILPRAQGDDWPTAVVREVFSQSRDHFVRVIPGESFGDTVGFSGAAKGPFATAEFYRREKAFPRYRRARQWEDENLARFLR